MVCPNEVQPKGDGMVQEPEEKRSFEDISCSYQVAVGPVEFSTKKDHLLGQQRVADWGKVNSQQADSHQDCVQVARTAGSDYV